MIDSHDITKSMAAALTADDNTPAGPSAGALLRKAREDAGMHLGMLSVALKVPVRNLMALEADQHALLSGPVFVRALANSVCRQLKMDAAPVLALLPPATNRLEVLHPGLSSTSSASGSFWLRRHWQAHRQGMSLAMGILLLIALVVWWPEHQTLMGLASTPSADVPLESAQVSDSAMPTVVMLPSDVSAPSNLPESNVPTSAFTNTTSPASAAPSTVAPAAKNSAAILEKPVQISPAAPTLPVESSLLLIGQSDAWVEVKNSTGQLVFNQLVKSGDRHLLKIEGTMNVVIGFADGVQVQLRGKPFDLTPFSKGAVARFEVK